MMMKPRSRIRAGRGLALALTLALVLAFPAALGAQSSTAASLLDGAIAAQLAGGGSASLVDSDGQPRLLPEHPSSGAVRTALAEEKPKVLVEALFFYPRSAPASEEGRRAELAAIYGLMRSFGTLRGISYYSQSQKAMEVLYVDSSRVSGPDGSLRLPDEEAPPPGALPGAERLYALLQDQRFGKNVYRYDFTTSPEAILVESTNETRMSYLLIPVFAPGQLKMRLLVLPTSDGILFYVESGANAPGFLRGRLGESFKNRAAALFGWFKEGFHSAAAALR